MNTPKKEIAKKGEYTISPAKSLSWRGAYARTLELVKSHIPVVLYGPPGTGKTKIVDDIRAELEQDGQLGAHEVVQFHNKFSYEDFIEGFEPTPSGGFMQKPGVFTKFCTRITAEKISLFVIDEMNRAELSSTLGEVLYAIENRATRKVKTAHFGNEFKIPESLSLVGTMNTADRNISIVDFALRRRFRFIPVYPDSEELRIWLQGVGFGFKEFSVNDYVTFFQKINHRILKHPLLGSHMQLGQSLFVPAVRRAPFTGDDITSNLSEVVIPQLEAYFGFGGQGELETILNPIISEKHFKQQTIEFADLVAFMSETIGEK
jgi:5-methylcytosine-specific restriction protein B